MALILDGSAMDPMDSLDAMSAAMPMDMPLQVDAMPVDAMQVDLEGVDLFGDPLHAPSKQLLQRMDELRNRGSCQTLAWSRHGTIASVGRDGRSIDLRFLRCSPEDGSWALSEASNTSTFAENFHGGPVVHLAFGADGSQEMAIIDSVGRTCIQSFSITLNHPYAARKWDADPIDDLHAVVGSYWLPCMPGTKQYNLLYGPALREGNSYRYGSSVVPAYPPWHPNPARSSLLTVTANGTLKLFYVQNNNKFEDISIELESVTLSDDLITHAALCSEKSRPSAPSPPSGSLLIALVTSSRQLQVVEATLDWGMPRAERQIPAGGLHLTPTLRERHVATTSLFDNTVVDGGSLESSQAQLSHIEVFPTTVVPEVGSSPTWAPPLVLAVRSHIAQPQSTYDQHQEPDESHSIIDCWHVLTETPQTLHQAFEDVGARAGLGSAPSVPTTRLKKLESVVISKVVVAVHAMQFGKVICFAFSDGTIQYRDRITLEELYASNNPERIYVLSQAGFQQSEESPCLQVVFSPSNNTFAQLCEDGSVKWITMRYSLGNIGSSSQDPSYATVISSLAVAVSAAAFQGVSYEDVLSIARTWATKKRFAFDWALELMKLLKVPVDYSEESHHNQLVRNPVLHQCLSILNHMGFRGDFQPRSFAGKFALLAVNVRNIVILITIASNTPHNLKEKLSLSPLDEPDVVDVLASCAKWTCDLLSWLTDCLFGLLDDQKFMSMLTPQRFSEMNAYLESQSDVALHLVLCSSTRGFLSAACRRLVHLDSISARAMQYYEKRAPLLANTEAGTAGQPSVLYGAYKRMHHYASNARIAVQLFDKLLSSLGADIRAAYQATLVPLANKQQQQQGPNQQQNGGADATVKRIQAQCELSMLLGGSPPPTFLPLIRKFFQTDLKAFRRETDPAKLFFADFSLLEVQDDPKTLAAKKAKGRYVDVFRRVDLYWPGAGRSAAAAVMQEEAKQDRQTQDAGLTNGLGTASRQWRRCVRCAAVMRDQGSGPMPPGYTYVLSQQRKCSCGGMWVLLPPGWLII